VNSAPDGGLQDSPAALRPVLSGPKSALILLAGFLILWCAFFGLYSATPYLRNASDVVKFAKQKYVSGGEAFPESATATKIAVFGNSKVLSGFIPDEFDRLASRDGNRTYSYNAGFPSQSESEFIDELETMTDRGVSPDIVLLAYTWESKPRHLSPFKLSSDDNHLANAIFPFRFFARNLSRFAVSSKRFGGLRAFYLKTKAASDRVLRSRGYYFIEELSQFPNNRLPSTYTLPSDHPNAVTPRNPDFNSAELDRLNRVIEKHHIRCLFIPEHARSTAAAPASSNDAEFAGSLAQHSTCRTLGPDYFSYSPVLYSDDLHLNPEGARGYTEDLYKLVSPYLLRRP
jgi:hypothetical protein